MLGHRKPRKFYNTFVGFVKTVGFSFETNRRRGVRGRWGSGLVTLKCSVNVHRYNTDVRGDPTCDGPSPLVCSVREDTGVEGRVVVGPARRVDVGASPTAVTPATTRTPTSRTVVATCPVGRPRPTTTPTPSATSERATDRPLHPPCFVSRHSSPREGPYRRIQRVLGTSRSGKGS